MKIKVRRDNQLFIAIGDHKEAEAAILEEDSIFIVKGKIKNVAKVLKAIQKQPPEHSKRLFSQ